MASKFWLLVIALALCGGSNSIPSPNPTNSPNQNQNQNQSQNQTPACPGTTLHLPNPPYDNYLFSDCHSASHVVVESPLPDGDLTVVSPRLLVAWPAGDSGLAVYFRPGGGEKNGSLALSLGNVTENATLVPVFVPSDQTGGSNPVVGISGVLQFNASAVLDIAILGSIRTIRDFEGSSTLQPVIQDAVRFERSSEDGVSAVVSRLWLDNETWTSLEFSPVANDSNIDVNNGSLAFQPGSYRFSASFNYTQLTQLNPQGVLNPQSQALLTSQSQSVETVQSLSFLSYSSKLLAGTWHYLTYFGRDTMISLLLMSSVLSAGEGGAIEAGLGAVLERVNLTDGRVCHEETIGDYASFTNLQATGLASTDPVCSYIMVDTDFYLPIVLANYLLSSPPVISPSRASEFLATRASFLPANAAANATYATLALRNAQLIVAETAAFAATTPGSQTVENLVHLQRGQPVGEWRDSEYGIGGGRVPYDVNAALVPAALKAIARLARAGYFPPEYEETWGGQGGLDSAAGVWERYAAGFFKVHVPAPEAKQLVEAYVAEGEFPFPAHAELIRDGDGGEGGVTFYGLARDGNDGQSVVRVMNSDDCFRLFLLDVVDDGDFLRQTADHVLNPFPVGLSTPVGMLVANPAFGGAPVYAANWTSADYQGTVVWGWPLAMMAAGLERQLGRCGCIISGNTTADSSGEGEGESKKRPAFCTDEKLVSHVAAAYSHLWDTIEANSPLLSSEVWTWTYEKENGTFVPAQLPGENDIRQLWSLTFLAVTRKGVVCG